MLLTIARNFHRWFRPAIDAVFTRDMPWAYRWRLMALQPIVFLTHSMWAIPYLVRRPFTVEWITVAPGRTLRILVFDFPLPGGGGRELRPLHLDAHGGAFMGGQPEEGTVFLERLARETGAVVVSASYRYAPRHTFPAAHDDMDAVVRYLQTNAAERWGADPQLMTVSGWSAGANLLLGAAQQEGCYEPAPTAIKGAVTFYGVMDLRLRPQDKPKPATFPTKDPLEWLMPLMDAYGAVARSQNMENPRLNPVLALVDRLPKDLLIVIGSIDILVHEQTTFVKRCKEEIAKTQSYSDRTVESVYLENLLHGGLNLPSIIVPMSEKNKAFTPSIEFIKKVYQKYGWVGCDVKGASRKTV